MIKSILRKLGIAQIVSIYAENGILQLLTKAEEELKDADEGLRKYEIEGCIERYNYWSGQCYALRKVINLMNNKPITASGIPARIRRSENDKTYTNQH
jgi:hypothetical protein